MLANAVALQLPAPSEGHRQAEHQEISQRPQSNTSFGEDAPPPWLGYQQTADKTDTIQKPDENSDKEPSRWGNNPDSWIAVSTIALTLFTGFFSVFTLGLYKETKRLARDARRSAKKSLRIAAATVAEMQDSDKRSLRPYDYIVIDQTGFLKVVVGEQIQGQVAFSVMGQTPAFGFRAGAHCAIMESPPPKDFDWLKKPQVDRYHRGDSQLNPGGTPYVPPVTGPVLTEEIVRDIILERQGIYMWGWVRYKDIFDRERSYFYLNARGESLRTGTTHIFNPYDGTDEESERG